MVFGTKLSFLVSTNEETRTPSHKRGLLLLLLLQRFAVSQ